MSVENPDYPNVAIPHTEGEFVNERKVGSSWLKQPVEAANMIDPKEKANVSCLAMILNNDPEGQANGLAQKMDCLTTSLEETQNRLCYAEDTATSYDILATSFKK